MEHIDESIKAYYPLGYKTLFLLILEKSLIFFSFLVGLFLILFFIDKVPSEYLGVAISALFIYCGLLIGIFGFTIFLGWLEYYRYGIFINERHLRLTRGLISIEQIGIPYRRVQDIRIKRGLLDQVLGISEIIITILSPNSGTMQEPFEEEDTIILPALDKNIALEIQNIILKKAQVEQIHFVEGPSKQE